MYTPLAQKTLTSGEPIEIGVVQTPDPRFEAEIRPLLGHKPQNFLWHLDNAFAGRIEGLETRFYLGLLKNVPICNIMTVEYKGIGILGHVYTVPAHRRKGACRLVMTEQMADFKNRSGLYLTLGTGFDTPPYWIYYSFGFRSVIPNSGHMKFMADEHFESECFTPGRAHVIEPDWKDWPTLNVLLALPDLSHIRNIGYRHFGPHNFEEGYLTMLESLGRNTEHHARLLESERGAPVGYATIMPDARWHGDVLLLDFFVHPDFKAYGHTLLQALPLAADRKIQCHATEEDDWKIAALLEEGFDHEATFRGQLNQQGRWIDVEVYGRRV